MESKKCPFGYLIGKDFGKFPECDNHSGIGNDCEPNSYYCCRDMNHSCGEKSDFGSKIMANFAARNMSSSKAHYSAYECSYCGGWHIGRG